jgi:hypothetical protein
MTTQGPPTTDATAVGVGRSYAYGLALGGVDGARLFLDRLVGTGAYTPLRNALNLAMIGK